MTSESASPIPKIHVECIKDFKSSESENEEKIENFTRQEALADIPRFMNFLVQQTWVCADIVKESSRIRSNIGNDIVNARVQTKITDFYDLTSYNRVVFLN